MLISTTENLHFLDSFLLLLIPFGVIVGLVAAVLGIGGGLLMVPALTFLGATPVQAIATSLIGIVISSISGTYQNWRMRQLDLEKVALMAPAAMLTTEIGVWAANALPARALLLSFAALQVGAIYLVDLKQRLKRVNSRIGHINDYPKYAVDQYRRRVVLTPVVELEPQVAIASKPQIFPTQGIGALAGILSGLFGVGGGIVMVPLQMLFLDQSIKDAVRTSLGAITLISAWAVGRHALAGNVLWLSGIYLGIGGLLGAQLGARLLPRLPDATVSTLFKSLLVLLALYMGSKAFLS